MRNNGLTGYDGDPWTENDPTNMGGIFKAANAAGKRPIGGGDAVLNVFRCPSVDLPDHVPDGAYFGASGTPINTGYAVSHYKASRGYCDRGMFWRSAEGNSYQTCTAIDVNGDGTLDVVDKLPYSRIRIQDVLDGTSKTIAVGEAAYFPSGNGTTAAIFPCGWAPPGKMAALYSRPRMLSIATSAQRAFPLSKEEIARLPAGKASDDCAFGWHISGVLFGFVDGSVHFLTENLELRTFALLGDRMDGEVIGTIE